MARVPETQASHGRQLSAGEKTRLNHTIFTVLREKMMKLGKLPCA